MLIAIRLGPLPVNQRVLVGESYVEIADKKRCHPLLKDRPSFSVFASRLNGTIDKRILQTAIRCGSFESAKPRRTTESLDHNSPQKQETFILTSTIRGTYAVCNYAG